MTKAATHSPTPRTPPVLVAACGNSMAGDDAFGPLVAARLREMRLDDVEVIDLGMKPAGLLNHLENRVGVIVVDAALPTGGFPVGSLRDWDFLASEPPQLVHDVSLSSHGLSIAHELQLAARLEMLPAHVSLVAAAVSGAEVGAAFSAETRKLVEPAARRAADLARRWLEPHSDLALKGPNLVAQGRAQRRPG